MAEQQLLVFKLDSEEYALPVLQIREIIKYQGATKLPNANSSLEGIINLRNKIIPVINLAKIFDLNNEVDTDSRVIIVENNIQDLGIIVNAVTEVLRIDENLIEKPPLQNKHSYIKGIGRTDTRMLMLLDLNELLETNNIQEVTQLR
ncbi:MAG: chemotaxis protein CheW [Firmicutes bacterium HGW-Firmicutes-12]|jgi:purine-binding chemotaxis protein CheW|nr:MAG: chemotaxis protein CheW [Firmicutes bacterium HGW-Firmicutes-12]